jgi:hypothetical protein
VIRAVLVVLALGCVSVPARAEIDPDEEVARRNFRQGAEAYARAD